MMAYRNWTSSDPRWSSLGDHEKAAAMSLMESDSGKDWLGNATNVLGAIHNRAGKEGVPLGKHVSGSIYQPTIEPAQQARLSRILSSPEYHQMVTWSKARQTGEISDPVGGATHFLAHEPVMERLRAQDPGKYKSWVNWTGYNGGGGKYQNVTHRDQSHAFLTPVGQSVTSSTNDNADAEAQGGGFYGEAKRSFPKPMYLGGPRSQDTPSTAQGGAAAPMSSAFKWTPEQNIARTDQWAKQFYDTPIDGRGGALGSILTGALSGLGSGMFSQDASKATSGNQAAMQGAMQGAANAPDALSLGKFLMGTGIPQLQQAGLGQIASAQEKAADRQQQERMLGLRTQEAVNQAKALAPIETEAAVNRARAMEPITTQGAINRATALAPIEFANEEQKLRLQNQFQIKLMQAKSEEERKQLMDKGRALGLIAPEAAPATPPMPGAEPVPQADAPAAAPQPPVARDPYQKLTQPAVPKAQDEADRKKRAAQSLMMGDPKGAAKILNKDEDLKDYQTKDALWAERMARAEITMRGNIGTPENPSYNPGRTANKFWPDDGILGMANSEKWRGYQAGAREWIASLLRKDTGAAVTDTEFKMYFNTYFPQPGDSADVQKQKLERRVAEASKLRAASGPAFDKMSPGFDQEMGDRLKMQEGAAAPGTPSGPVRVNTPEEAMRLPPGTKFLTPDGKVKVRP